MSKSNYNFLYSITREKIYSTVMKLFQKHKYHYSYDN